LASPAVYPTVSETKSIPVSKVSRLVSRTFQLLAAETEHAIIARQAISIMMLLCNTVRSRREAETA
jgi:hypothetical protein